MPPTLLATQTIPGAYSTTGLVLTANDADAVDGNEVAAEDSLFILVRNAGASARTFTITSQPDGVTGRLGNVSVSIAAGELRLFRLKKDGWAHPTTGRISLSGNHTDLKISPLKF